MENDLHPLRLLTVPEAAELLQVSTRTLLRMVWRKELPAFKVGGQWRISESRFAEWIQGLLSYSVSLWRPGEGGEKAYRLLTDAMEQSSRMALQPLNGKHE